MYFNKFRISIFILSCALDIGLCKEIPKFIEPCKWDQDTINSCILKNVINLRDKKTLQKGIPELDIPPLDPLCINEEVTTNLPGMSIRAKNVTVIGSSDFNVTHLNMDLDKCIIKLKAIFPKIHTEGHGMLNTVLLTLPINGEGDFTALSVLTEASAALYYGIQESNGNEYMEFEKLNLDLTMGDSKIRLDGFFKDKVISEAFNHAINHNRKEVLRLAKPHIEAMVTKVLLSMANNLVKGIPVNKIFVKD